VGECSSRPSTPIARRFSRFARPNESPRTAIETPGRIECHRARPRLLVRHREGLSASQSAFGEGDAARHRTGHMARRAWRPAARAAHDRDFLGACGPTP